MGIEADYNSYQGQSGCAYEYRFWEKILLDVKAILEKIENLFTFDERGSAESSEKMHTLTDLNELARFHANT